MVCIEYEAYCSIVNTDVATEGIDVPSRPDGAAIHDLSYNELSDTSFSLAYHSLDKSPIGNEHIPSETRPQIPSHWCPISVTYPIR